MNSPKPSATCTTSSLIALGFILFVITFSVIVAARFMLLRLDRRGAVVRMTAGMTTQRRALSKLINVVASSLSAWPR